MNLGIFPRSTRSPARERKVSVATVVFYFMAILLAALLLEPLAHRLHLPFSAALVAGGFAGSQLLVGMGVDTGLRWHHFHDLVFFVFLPVLIFESAVTLDARLLLRNLFPILLLALPLLLLSVVLIGLLLYFGIGYPQGFPWIAALLAGVLLSATDPVAVTELARRLPLPPRLLILMDGESLFNDAATVVLFMLLLSAAVGQSVGDVDLPAATLTFLRLSFGGLALGLLAGVAGRWLIHWLGRPVIVSLMAAYGSYLAAETWLGVSGVMATLACGLWLGSTLRRDTDGTVKTLLAGWEQLGWVSNSAVFLLAGVTITVTMFEERWLAMLLGVGAVLVTRLLVVWLAAVLTPLLPGQQPVSVASRVVLFVGGLRGAITLALALTLPLELEGWWTVQSIAYGVVVFSLFVQAPLLEPLVKQLQRRGHLRMDTPDVSK